MAKCSIYKYDAKSRGAQDYMKLVKTIARQTPHMISVSIPEVEEVLIAE